MHSSLLRSFGVKPLVPPGVLEPMKASGVTTPYYHGSMSEDVRHTVQGDSQGRRSGGTQGWKPFRTIEGLLRSCQAGARARDRNDLEIINQHSGGSAKPKTFHQAS
jgi:hypothetical protein